MVFRICEGISCFSFSVKELDVIVHKNYFLIWSYSFLAILYLTSLANLVVGLGIVTRSYYKRTFPIDIAKVNDFGLEKGCLLT